MISNNDVLIKKIKLSDYGHTRMLITMPMTAFATTRAHCYCPRPSNAGDSNGRSGPAHLEASRLRSPLPRGRARLSSWVWEETCFDAQLVVCMQQVWPQQKRVWHQSAPQYLYGYNITNYIILIKKSTVIIIYSNFSINKLTERIDYECRFSLPHKTVVTQYKNNKFNAKN